MSDDRDGEHDRCAVCGRYWDDSDLDPEEWVTLEVTAGLEDAPQWYPSFCSRAHAAAWFASELPAPDPPAPRAANETRVSGWGLTAFGAVCAVLLTLGAITLVRWLVDLF
jgi:hypothetical protein